MKKVKPEQMSSEIKNILEQYKDIAADELKDAVKKTANDVKKDIIANAPKKTGAYKKSWTVTKVRESSNKIELVVRSKNRYQLAHLLEKGHAKRGGGRVNGKPHIEPARKRGEKELESKLKEGLS